MNVCRWAVATLGSLVLFFSCQSSSQTETGQSSASPTPTQLTGPQLAQTYCGSCHLAPDPSLLDKTTWQQGVLPRMALRMGQSDQQMNELMQHSNPEELNRLLVANVFPEQPMLHPADWQKLVAYYTTKAPDKLPAQQAHAPLQPLPLFTAQRSERAVDALVTLLTYDSVAHRIWTGDVRGNLYALDPQLRRIDSLRMDSPVVDLQTQPDGSLRLLNVGVLNPNDQLAGSLQQRAGNNKPPTPLLSKLQRPVQATYADLNRDGREDIIVCQFGNYLGALTWHESLAGQKEDGPAYREHVLDAVPGARMAFVQDVNRDQWPDVVALLTQGDEQIAVYYNQRNGSFRKETVLRFPPVYGSSYFELADMDGDGDPDLVYTNGDNADYSIVLKPYHGVRIFLNDGSFRFRESWFYPLHGATQTIVRDFDRDGDADIAAIAHFPDFAQQPYQGFVYFENTGKLTFIARTFPTANRGRWLRMAAGDVDQDGDDDILLGSFFKPTGPAHASLMEYWRKPGTGVLLLKNRLR